MTIDANLLMSEGSVCMGITESTMMKVLKL